MIADKKLVYDKETGIYQKVIGAKYHYPSRPKNPLVYDKETGIYQKEERKAKRVKVERHSGEDVSEVYVPMERTYATSIMSSSPVPMERTYATSIISSSPVPLERTYATSIINAHLRGFESDYFKNFKPSSSVRYIGGSESDYIKNFRIPK